MWGGGGVGAGRWWQLFLQELLAVKQVRTYLLLFFLHSCSWGFIGCHLIVADKMSTLRPCGSCRSVMARNSVLVPVRSQGYEMWPQSFIVQMALMISKDRSQMGPLLLGTVRTLQLQPGLCFILPTSQKPCFCCVCI